MGEKFSDFWLALIFGLLTYAVLFGFYVVLLRVRGKRYERRSPIPVLVLLPLALVIGSLAKSLVF